MKEICDSNKPKHNITMIFKNLSNQINIHVIICYLFVLECSLILILLEI